MFARDTDVIERLFQERTMVLIERLDNFGHVIGIRSRATGNETRRHRHRDQGLLEVLVLDHHVFLILDLVIDSFDCVVCDYFC
jgi:hypothetical protein